MNADDAFARLLTEVAAVYRAHADMTRFAPFPNNIVRQPVDPLPLPCGEWLARETALHSDRFSTLQTAIVEAGRHAHWRATYKDTDIGDDFLDRFGCYAIIGPEGPFASDEIRLWMVYMPAQLDYTWHHHPAEEIYLVVSGQAVFRRNGAPDKMLGESQTSFHESNQSHAMTTTDAPVLCLVAWRNEFDTPPVLS